MSQDWYARRLGQQHQQPQAPQQRYSPPTQPHYPQQHQPQPQHQQQPDTSQIRVTTQNLYEVAGMWRGGPAARTEGQPCPNCGSNHYFSRAGKSRLPAPAPHCFDCGYNGLFDQGLPQTWGAA